MVPPKSALYGVLAGAVGGLGTDGANRPWSLLPVVLALFSVSVLLWGGVRGLYLLNSDVPYDELSTGALGLLVFLALGGAGANAYLSGSLTASIALAFAPVFGVFAVSTVTDVFGLSMMDNDPLWMFLVTCGMMAAVGCVGYLLGRSVRWAAATWVAG